MKTLIASAILAMLATSAQAGVVVYTAFLDGPSESPPNGSPATGFAEVDIDNVAQTMRVQVTFSGLTGTTTASHIHCCTVAPGAGTAIVATQTPTFTGFPLGVTSGTYDHTFDLTLTSTYNGAFVTANGGTAASAEAALIAGMNAGEAYLNVHSQTFGGGEIRGFLIAEAPEPGTFVLAGAVVVGLLLRRRKLTRA